MVLQIARCDRGVGATSPSSCFEEKKKGGTARHGTKPHNTPCTLQQRSGREPTSLAYGPYGKGREPLHLKDHSEEPVPVPSDPYICPACTWLASLKDMAKINLSWRDRVLELGQHIRVCKSENMNVYCRHR
jgi:hypothetical protein